METALHPSRKSIPHSFSPVRRLLLVVWIARVGAGAAPAETVLPVQRDLWIARVLGLGGLKMEEAARFEIARSEHGNALVIGPWRGGSGGARFEYSGRLPITNGSLKGWYKTVNLLPREAAVTIQFWAQEKRLSSRNFPMAASAGWMWFEVPIYRAPEGADSVVISVGLAEHTEGRVYFAGLRAGNEPYRVEFPAEPGPLTRPKPPRVLPARPYFRLVKENGAWWFVSPEGKPFFSIGVDPRPFGQAKTEDPQQVYELMHELGFNSLAGWHNLRLWSRFNDAQAQPGRAPLIQFRSFQTRTDDPPYETVRDARGLNPGTQSAQAIQRGGFNHAFPDPWDPRWEAWLREQVRAASQLVKGRPYFAAWFADNEREHRQLHRYVYSRYCAQAFREFLRKRHGTIRSLNRAWGTKFASFEDLLEQKPEPTLRAGRMYEDFHEFRREIIRRFNETVLRVIREEDPGRLVFTNRFMIGEGRDLVENLDLYRDFDGVAVNIYPSNLKPGLAPEERAMLELIHARTGKPILIGEWSVPALDSGLYNNPTRLDWSYPNAVETQQQRARQAALVLTELYNLPYVVGAHWFIWTDFDSPIRQANRGLFKVNGEPWRELQQSLRAVHSRIRAHLGH